MSETQKQFASTQKVESISIAERLREGRSIIRPVSQVTLRLKADEKKDRFASTVDDILHWMNRRAGRALPPAAWQRQSFELSEIGTQRTAAVALKEPKYWAARLDDADKQVPLRTWVTEIGVAADGNGDVLFGARLICATRGADEPFERSVPSFVRRIIRSGSAELDGVRLSPGPRLVRTEEEVADLIALLEMPGRCADVVVFSLPEDSEDPTQTAASAMVVSAHLYGIAHVCVLTGPASFALTSMVGRELTTFRQAVRVYRPGFRAWLDQTANHPLILPSRIAAWSGIGVEAFERWILNFCLGNSVRGAARNERLPSFTSVRQLAAQEERVAVRVAGGSDHELLQLFEADNQQLRAELKEQREQYDGLLAVAEAERDAAAQAADAAKAQALERLHRIRALEKRAKELTVTREPDLPSSLDDFEEWCQANLAGAVELAGRAYQGVRKSSYHDPMFIYRALLLLRDYYVPMRVDATAEKRQAYQKALEDLQLEESATGEGIKYAADQYSVQYGGSRRALDRHLKGSDSRDRRYGFRLYFFWDEEGEVVVVGWLPSHLDNRLT